METNDNKKVMVAMTPEEAAHFNEFRAKQAAQDAEEKRQKEIKAYKSLVDNLIAETVIKAKELHSTMKEQKNNIIESFQTAIELKEGLYKGQKSFRDERFTDTFTNSDSNARVTLGYQTNDNYDDTYTQGVEKVKEYIQSLASDEGSSQLVEMVNTLLSERSKGGQLRAQNVLRLDKLANDSGNAKFIEGMKIIRDAYRPIKSKQFIRVDVKDEKTNEWIPVSLNMTNC